MHTVTKILTRNNCPSSLRKPDQLFGKQCFTPIMTCIVLYKNFSQQNYISETFATLPNKCIDIFRSSLFQFQGLCKMVSQQQPVLHQCSVSSNMHARQKYSESKLRRLGLPNQIIDNSRSDSNNFEQRNLADSKSDNVIRVQLKGQFLFKSDVD